MHETSGKTGVFFTQCLFWTKCTFSVVIVCIHPPQFSLYTVFVCTYTISPADASYFSIQYNWASHSRAQMLPSEQWVCRAKQTLHSRVGLGKSVSDSTLPDCFYRKRICRNKWHAAFHSMWTFNMPGPRRGCPCGQDVARSCQLFAWKIKKKYIVLCCVTGGRRDM